MEKTLTEAAESLLKKGEITQEEYEKVAGFEKSSAVAAKSLWGKIQSPVGVAVGGALTLLTAGALAKELIIDPISEKMKLDKSYKDMFVKVPQLKEMNPEQVRDYFDVVKTFSPHTASNPIVAGHIVNKMMEFGGVDHKLVQDLMDMQGNIKNREISKAMIGQHAEIYSDLERGPLNRFLTTKTDGGKAS